MVAGRRSKAQVRGYDWTGDPEPYLDGICVFGPLPDDDVMEAAPLTMDQ